MTTRPLTPPELAYLKRYKASLDASLQALWITLGLVALPLMFLASALRTSQDRLAMGLAGTIMIVLVAAVVYYSARSHQERKLGLAEAALLRGLSADLAAQTAVCESVVVTGKETKQRKARRAEAFEEGGRDREYWLIAGDKRYQVGPSTYMAAAAGQPLELEVASHSRVVLVVDGLRERVPLAQAPGRGDELEAF